MKDGETWKLFWGFLNFLRALPFWNLIRKRSDDLIFPTNPGGFLRNPFLERGGWKFYLQSKQLDEAILRKKFLGAFGATQGLWPVGAITY